MLDMVDRAAISVISKCSSRSEAIRNCCKRPQSVLFFNNWSKGYFYTLYKLLSLQLTTFEGVHHSNIDLKFYLEIVFPSKSLQKTMLKSIIMGMFGVQSHFLSNLQHLNPHYKQFWWIKSHNNQDVGGFKRWILSSKIWSCHLGPEPEASSLHLKSVWC